MSFDWKDYLKAAEILHEGAEQASLEEAMYRIAISRAYYAAFCLARNHKINEGIEIPIKDQHKFVGDLYWDSDNDDEHYIGRKLSRLKHHRTKADYEDTIASPKQVSEDSIKEAKLIIDMLDKLKA